MSSPNSEILSSHSYQSVVTPLALLAVQRHHYAFFHLYPYIFEMGVDKQGLIFFKSVPFTRKHIPWLLSHTVITGICGLGSCVYTCVARLIIGVEIKPWVDWSLFKTLIILGLGSAATLELGATFVLYRSSVVFQAFRKLLLLEQKCIYALHEKTQTMTENETEVPERGSNSIVHRKTKDPFGILLNILVLISIVIPLPMAVVGTATNLDPFYFITEQVLLPHPYYRSIKTIVLLPLVRMILTYFCIVEFLRFIVMTAFVLGITIFVMVSVSTKLAHVFYEKCLLLFVQLRLIFGSIKLFTANTTSVLVFGTQFVNILLLWIVFKCFELLSTVIYVMVCCFAIYILLVCAVLLPTITKIRTETKQLIETKRCLHFCSSRKSKKYYYYSLWKSQKSVYFACGTFFIVQRGVTMSYMENLINNLVNAVILIDPINK